MKPIETRYNGRLFRSRLEARWAVLLDAVWLRWEYEVEGFVLPSGPYLPDFFLRLSDSPHPGAGYWVEIKPRLLPSDLELRRVEDLCRETGHNGFLVAGNPARGEFSFWKFSRRYPHRPDGGLIYAHTEATTLGWPFLPPEWMGCTDVPWEQDHWTLLDGFERATAERFESGRRPQGWDSPADVLAGAHDGILGSIRRRMEAEDQARSRPEGTETA